MLRENFFYDDLARPIADQIMKSISAGNKNFEDYIRWPYDIPIMDNASFINWSFKILRMKDIQRADIWASAGPDENCEPSLDFAIVLRKGQHQKKASIEYSELFGVIAHELHHIAQNTEKVGHHFLVPVCKSKQMSYYIDPIEVEAFNLGFRAQSSISGIPIEEIMRDYLSLQMLNQKETDYIIKLWMNTDYPVLRKNLEEK